MLPIDDLLTSLAAERPVFHSEADFQHALAWLIQRAFPGAIVRLEIPLLCGASVSHVDILVTIDFKRAALELKYKTKSADVTQTAETFSLGNHAANDHGRYDFLKDVERVELLVDAGTVSQGYAILLTNDRLYWTEQRQDANDRAFHLSPGRVVSGELAWAPTTGKGTVAKRERALVLRGAHECHWRDYSQVDASRNGEFRCLVFQSRSAAV